MSLAVCGRSILIQGFVALFFIIAPTLTLAVMDRRVGWLHGLRPVMGVLLCVALVAPWMSSMSQATDAPLLRRLCILIFSPIFRAI